MQSEHLHQNEEQTKFRDRQKAERRLELCLASAGLGIWTYNIATDEYWANDRAKQLHGHEPHEVHTFAEAGATIHPEDRDRAQAAIAEAIQTHSNLQLEYRVVWRDGSIHWIVSQAEFVPASVHGQGVFYGSVQDINERKRIEAEHQQAEAAIAADLRDTQLLQDLSARLVAETDIQVLYDEIMAAAIALMQADAGSLQVLDEATQELVLIAIQGIIPAMAEHFYRVDARSNTSCGIALATGQRTFTDFDLPECGDPDGSRRLHVEAGFLSAQSTPLISRSGKPIGMFSTHWCKHHRPSDRELRFLDLLARQAADLIEQRQAEQALRESEERQTFLLKFSDALRPLADLVDIQETVTRTAMNHFGSDRCYYCEIEDGNAIIRRDASREDLPSVAGVYPMSSFAILQSVVDAGHPFVVQDVHTTDLVDEDLRQLCIQLQVISFVDVPVIKNGKPVGILCLVQSTPRD